jgi:poly-gamma-glutamate synthesis protein (capsule biosynthesis protein)
MAYADSPHHPALVELARSGNFRAIARWLNQVLLPHGMRAFVGAMRPGCLKILVELHPDLRQDQGLVSAWQDTLVRFVCHRLWKLNSALIEGVRVAARFSDEPTILWERSVRIASPARRTQHQQSHKLKTQIQQTARRKSQLKTMRVLLMSGSTVFAFVVGAIVAYVKAPVDQSSAVPSPTVVTSNRTTNQVQTAMETVSVVKHNQVVDPKDPTVSLLFSGDVTLSDAFADTVGKDYKWAFAKLDLYRQADLAMVNLENPLTKASTPMPGKQFNFKADPDMVQVLKEGGVDLVTLANNHTMDYQSEGLLETMSTLDKAGILHLGAGRDITEARRPEIIDVKGQRIAYLGYFGEDYAATDQSAGTSPIMEARISQDIKAIRNQVDWVVVNFHWGQENASHPADWQVELARYTIDQGADVIVGHHPHVLQGAEIYKGRPIAYSLGNFIFGGNSRSDYDTAILKVSVKDKQMKVEFVPIEVKQYQAMMASAERGQQILSHISELSADFPQPLKSPVILDASRPAAATPTNSTPEASTSPLPQPESTPAASPSPESTPDVAPEPSASGSEAETTPQSDRPSNPDGADSESAPATSAPESVPSTSTTPMPSESVPETPVPAAPSPIVPTPYTPPLPADITAPYPGVIPDPTATPPSPALPSYPDPTMPVPPVEPYTPPINPYANPVPDPYAPTPNVPPPVDSGNSFTNSPNHTPLTPAVPTSPVAPIDLSPTDPTGGYSTTPGMPPGVPPTYPYPPYPQSSPLAPATN